MAAIEAISLTKQVHLNGKVMQIHQNPKCPVIIKNLGVSNIVAVADCKCKPCNIPYSTAEMFKRLDL